MERDWQIALTRELRKVSARTWLVAPVGAAMALVTLAGCGDSPGTGTPGELGDGTFEYRCENSGDLKCSETNAVDEFEIGSDMGGSDTLPLAVAVGATFGIRYAGSVRSGGDDVLVTVDSVSAEDRRGPNVYAIQQPLQAAITATDNDGKVVDFAVITALEATELGVWHRQDEVDRLAVDVGDMVELTVAPRGESGTFLAGALPYEWRVLDDSVAGISEIDASSEGQDVNNQGDIELVGLSAGTTTLRVRSRDLEAVVEVEVRP
jgi:hypothetical protein